MKTIRRWGLPGLFMGLLLLCSCTTVPEPEAIVPAAELPAAVIMNHDAGHGMWLVVTLRLEDGEGLPCFVDTGANTTMVDQSLEPTLEKRLRTETIWHLATKSKSHYYAAPKLYLGNIRLITGKTVCTSDLKDLSFAAGRPIKAILGTDCLKHYCLQLDFEAGKIRFLDPNRIDPGTLGRAYPLRSQWGMPYIHTSGLTGGNGRETLIDTGWLEEDGLGERNPATNIETGTVHLTECVWEGETYTNVEVALSDHRLYGDNTNILGLGFLARHLVTLNFPKEILYLRQTRVGPLVDDDIATARKFLHDLKLNGRQPGWTKEDHGDYSWPEESANTLTFKIVKNGNSSIYHYVVAKASKDEPCKLLKAWRTDQNGRAMEEYPVP